MKYTDNLSCNHKDLSDITKKVTLPKRSHLILPQPLFRLI
ncbi:hypothetical protein GCWU000342_00754 [Shuttleworthella satelles DSM 14600]|uniref:Uncharacterized protein n=1 Tax=Shuttleworthella satelles DSM 14600 TaxID=626523 RepID=C4G9U9_9FIRM|nr:hypothetical protein GCWU000342_00754 [Shuttleworthia satelles DSM 14600]